MVGGSRFLTEEALAQIDEVQTAARDYTLGIRMNRRLGYHSAFVASGNQYRRRNTARADRSRGN